MKTLYGKLALALTGLLVAVGLVYLLLGQSLTQRTLQEAHQRFNRDLARNLVADRQLVSDGQIDRQALEQTFHMYMVINPSIEIYLLDPQGRILAYSADPDKVKRRRVSLAPIRAFLHNDTAFPILGDDPRSHDQRKIFSVTPLPSARDPEGWLYVVLRGEEYDAVTTLHRDSLLLRLSAWTLAGSLLLGLLAGLLLFAWLTRRLRRLARHMDAFAAADFARYTPYQDRGDDEISQLGRHFDALAVRMQTLLGQLQERDALRRELLNNVSHDLRTPLTSLHGYLETLRLKEASLDSRQRRAYLDTALNHARRLSRLVEELFQLARLEAGTVQPRKEAFPPAELLQDVAQGFALMAEQKGVSLETRLPDQPLWVEADIGLLERVLENLIANALRHTPAGGRVRLRLIAGDGAACFAVADTGGGIPPRELPHVFERFYRGARAASERHAGLGLAIARHIVALHGAELTVSSRLGAGSCFRFALPLAAT